MDSKETESKWNIYSDVSKTKIKDVWRHWSNATKYYTMKPALQENTGQTYSSNVSQLSMQGIFTGDNYTRTASTFAALYRSGNYSYYYFQFNFYRPGFPEWLQNSLELPKVNLLHVCSRYFRSQMPFLSPSQQRQYIDSKGPCTYYIMRKGWGGVEVLLHCAI